MKGRNPKQLGISILMLPLQEIPLPKGETSVYSPSSLPMHAAGLCVHLWECVQWESLDSLNWMELAVDKGQGQRYQPSSFQWSELAGEEQGIKKSDADESSKRFSG